MFVDYEEAMSSTEFIRVLNKLGDQENLGKQQVLIKTSDLI